MIDESIQHRVGQLPPPLRRRLRRVYGGSRRSPGGRYIAGCQRRRLVIRAQNDAAPQQGQNQKRSVTQPKHNTAGHTKRVAAYSYTIAKELKYSDEELSKVRHAAYLHDIGKLGVDVELLDKVEKLSNEEFDKIKEHARYSYEILADIDGLKKFAFGALHHERVDGKGYPFGLKGDELPEGAKIIAIADVLDALTSNRSYRKPFTFKEAFELMEMMVGTAFDRNIFESSKRCFNI